MRNLAFSMVLTLFFSRALPGQTPEGLRALALPEGQPILCREPERDSTHPLPPQIIAREFRFGGSPDPMAVVWRREINVAFDSLGRALFLTDEAVFGLQGGETVFAKLDSAGVVMGRRMTFTVDSVAQDHALANGDVAGARAAHRPPVTRSLTPEESRQLSALSAWLWKRRCPAN